MHLRNEKSGITKCEGYKSLDTQQTCNDFQPASYHRRCMFLRDGGRCDWHPDYGCVKILDEPPKAKSMYEQHQEWMDEVAEAECGI